jgi:hypothetical protein
LNWIHFVASFLYFAVARVYICVWARKKGTYAEILPPLLHDQLDILAYDAFNFRAAGKEHVKRPEQELKRRETDNEQDERRYPPAEKVPHQLEHLILAIGEERVPG